MSFACHLDQQGPFFSGITLAITRDGSSGGCARIAIIDKDGVERIDILGDDLCKVFAL